MMEKEFYENPKTRGYIVPESEEVNYETVNTILTGSGEDWQVGED